MLETDIYLLRQRFLTWDCLVPLTMLVLELETSELCRMQRSWLLLLSRTCIVTPMLMRVTPPQKDLCISCELSSCAALPKSQWMGGGFGWLFMSAAASRRLSVVLANCSTVLRSQPRHSVPANLACDKGRPVNSYGQAGEVGGNMQLSSAC